MGFTLMTRGEMVVEAARRAGGGRKEMERAAEMVAMAETEVSGESSPDLSALCTRLFCGPQFATELTGSCS
jgi:hypothetical protein